MSDRATRIASPSPLVRRRRRDDLTVEEGSRPAPREAGSGALGNDHIRRRLATGGAPVHFTFAHRAALGNRSVQRLLPPPAVTGSIGAPLTITRSPAVVQRAPGPLTPAQEQAAITFHTAHFDGRSTQIIQTATATAANRAFNDVAAQGVATFQQTRGLLVDGKVGNQTLNTLVPRLVTAGSHDEAIQLVVNFGKLNVTRDTLTIRHDPTLVTDGATTFEAGNTRAIRLGRTAFTSATKLRSAISAQLARPAPKQAKVGTRPTLLTKEQEQAAIAANQVLFSDLRSLRVIQGLVGTGFDAKLGPDTVERIAAFQAANAVPSADGIVNEATMRVMVPRLDSIGQQNSAIRLIIDFFNLSEFDSLLDIRFDASVTANASTTGEIPGPALVRVGPKGFARGFAALVHTIAHELEHVRQNREGIAETHISEFLGEEVEILSVGMPEEDATGLMNDADRALHHWKLLTVAVQRAEFARFTGVRTKLRQRFAAFTAAEKTAHKPLMDQYDAVTKP